MAPHVEHELHSRRRSRNVGLGVVLALFVLLVMALTMVKVSEGDPMKGFDHRMQDLSAPSAPAPAADGVAPATGTATRP